jgi:hypothetical protein
MVGALGDGAGAEGGGVLRPPPRRPRGLRYAPWGARRLRTPGPHPSGARGPGRPQLARPTLPPAGSWAEGGPSSAASASARLTAGGGPAGGRRAGGPLPTVGWPSRGMAAGSLRFRASRAGTEPSRAPPPGGGAPASSRGLLVEGRGPRVRSPRLVLLPPPRGHREGAGPRAGGSPLLG